MVISLILLASIFLYECALCFALRLKTILSKPLSIATNINYILLKSKKHLNN